jgi:3-isopropylmalate/(R)-2-methylmalate dehydratase small subunit
MRKIRGKVHLFDIPHINTDDIIPARYLITDKEEELAKHAMEMIDPDFPSKVGDGDILVASINFGCGSSREHAVWAIRGTGIRAVVAESFARIFYRNCINNGLLAIEMPGVTKLVSYGDEVEIDPGNGIFKNLTSGDEGRFVPMPDFIMEIVESGGLIEYIKRRG